MSLKIDIDKVSQVLLADCWHYVSDESFGLGTYEFICNKDLIHPGGNSEVCSTGFIFKESVLVPYPTDEGDTEDIFITGPLTAILAVRFK